MPAAKRGQRKNAFEHPLPKKQKLAQSKASDYPNKMNRMMTDTMEIETPLGSPPQSASESPRSTAGLIRHMRHDDNNREQTESQQFLALVKYGARQIHEPKKTSDFLDTFKAESQLHQKSLLDKLQSLEHDTKTRDQLFLNGFRDAYNAVLTRNTQSDTRVTTASFVSMEGDADSQRLRAQGDAVLATASKLISIFEHTAGQIVDQSNRTSVKGKWDKDIARLKHVLDAGHTLGQRKVESVLSTNVAGADNATSSAEESVSGLYSASATERLRETTWGVDAKKQKKLVRKLVDTLRHE